MPHERGESDQRAVHACTGAARVVERRDQEQDAGRDDRDALEDAQRARRQAENVLRVERVTHETGAGEKAQRVAGPAADR